MASKKVYTKEDIKNYWEAMRKAMFSPDLVRTAGSSILWFFSTNGYTKFFFTQESLGKIIGMERKSVNRAILALEKAGYLIITRPPHGSHKPLQIELIKELQAPTKYIFGLHDTDSSWTNLVHDMDDFGTGGEKENMPVMDDFGTHNGVNGNNTKGSNSQAELGRNSKLTLTTTQLMGKESKANRADQLTPYLSLDYKPLLDFAKRNPNYIPDYDTRGRNYDQIEKAWINECLKKMSLEELKVIIETKDIKFCFARIANEPVIKRTKIFTVDE